MDFRGPTWNTMPEILLEILRSGGGGFVIFGGGSRKGGFPDEPPEPPCLRACTTSIVAHIVRSQ